MRRASVCGNSRIVCRTPPISPMSISGRPNTAFSEARMMSEQTDRPIPAPKAGPLTAAITGLVDSMMQKPISRFRLAQRGVETDAAFQIEADVALIGKAHRAVKMDGAAADREGGFAGTRLRGQHRKLRRIAIAGLKNVHRIDDGRTGEFRVHPH